MPMTTQLLQELLSVLTEDGLEVSGEADPFHLFFDVGPPGPVAPVAMCDIQTIAKKDKHGWNMDGIWMEYGWDMDGIWMGYGWNMDGIWMEYGWDMDGIWMGYGWNMDGIWMEYGWDMDGIWMVWDQNHSESIALIELKFGPRTQSHVSIRNPPPFPSRYGLLLLFEVWKLASKLDSLTESMSHKIQIETPENLFFMTSNRFKQLVFVGDSLSRDSIIGLNPSPHEIASASSIKRETSDWSCILPLKLLFGSGKLPGMWWCDWVWLAYAGVSKA